MDRLKTAVDRIAVVPRGYWFEQLPSVHDISVALLCRIYLDSSDEQRKTLVSCLDERAVSVCLGFADRMAMLGAREKSEAMLLGGLVATVLVSDLLDPREVLIVLSILYNSSMRLGLDVLRLFGAAAELTISEPSRSILLGYLQSDGAGRDITLLGYHEIEGPAGLIYWHGDPLRIPEGLKKPADQGLVDALMISLGSEVVN